MRTGRTHANASGPLVGLVVWLMVIAIGNPKVQFDGRMRVQIPEATLAEIKEALFRGQKLQAIKLYREYTETGLAEAKTALDELEAELRSASPDKFTAAPSAKGCFGVAVIICVMATAAVLWLVGK
jgi:hypothetical protein